ncbi:MAG: hypothetical protein OEL88_09820 [Sterolibacteriaceae bacterium MAG5]|nr:hypothetical protein [Candidatus Nitricoxidireducens bremensis]
MHITQSNLELSSKHELESTSSRLLRFMEQPRGEASFAKRLDAALNAAPPQILTVETPETAQGEVQSVKKDKDPFDTIMQMLFGLPASADADAVSDETSAGNVSEGGRMRAALPGMRVMELLHTSETESCTFSASGNICLADGSTRQFDVGYHMERSEESTRLTTGSFRDPLVLDFGEPGTRLNEHSVDFDLDSDGQVESMRMPAGNSAVLFHDINGNGIADNGSELFGPATGNGFGELAKLDSDGNGWIDEGDAAYDDLMLWHFSDDGQSSYESLEDAEIGALATLSAETPFTLKEDGEAVGQVRASSVWLGEHSGAGIVRQIDVATTPKETASA